MHAGPRYKTQRWIEGLADPLVPERHVPEIIWVVDLEAGRGAVAALEILPTHAHTPQADEEVLVAAEVRRLIGEIRSGEPAAAPLQWISRRRDEPDR